MKEKGQMKNIEQGMKNHKPLMMFLTSKFNINYSLLGIMFRLITKKQGIIFTLLCLLLLFVLFQSKSVLADSNIYRDLIDRGVATYEDGCRSIARFVNVPEGTMTFEEVVLELKKKEIVGGRWEYKAEKPLTRGIMGYMICNVLNIKGGFVMRAINTTKRFASLICDKLKIKDGLSFPDIGMTKRYAYFECQSMGIEPSGNIKIFLSGHDLLALMFRLEQYIKAEEKKKKRKEEKERKKEEKVKSEESSE
jgi:hypothetical protein